MGNLIEGIVYAAEEVIFLCYIKLKSNYQTFTPDVLSPKTLYIKLSFYLILQNASLSSVLYFSLNEISDCKMAGQRFKIIFTLLFIFPHPIN